MEFPACKPHPTINFSGCQEARRVSVFVLNYGNFALILPKICPIEVPN